MHGPKILQALGAPMGVWVTDFRQPIRPMVSSGGQGYARGFGCLWG